jgi:excisionase family DNA binding protein
MKEEVLTSKEAAESLHVHLKTVYKLATEGTLPGKRSAGAGVFLGRKYLRRSKETPKKMLASFYITAPVARLNAPEA